MIAASGPPLRNHVGAAIALLLAALSAPLEAQQSANASSWRAGRTLASDLRIEEVAPDTPIGRIDCILALPDGGVVITDGKGPDGVSILHFGPTGRFIARLGRTGGGPGEHGTYFFNGCLTLTPAGEVALQDPVLSRLTIWDLKQSTSRMIPLPSRLSGTPPMVIWHRDGSALVKVMNTRADAAHFTDPSAYALLRLTNSGAITDTIGLPLPSPAVPFAFGWYTPWNVSTILPSGTRLIATNHGTGFTLLDRTGKTREVDRRWPRIRVSRDEHRQAEQFVEWDYQQAKGRVPKQAVSDVKPTFSAVQVAVDGLIWFRISAPGKKGFARRLYSGPRDPKEPRETIREPWLFDVLTSDGTPVASVALQDVRGAPLNFATSGLTVWAAVEAPDGSHTIVRWR